MKNNHGFTMIQIVITVIMMVLIAGFSMYNARNTIVETRIIRTYDEMVEVKNAVKGLLIFEEDKIDTYLGTASNDLSVYPQLGSYYDSSIIHKYYFLDFKTDKERLNDILELSNVENNYIVDLGNLENIEVYIENGVKVNENTYYTISEIEKEYNSIFSNKK